MTGTRLSFYGGLDSADFILSIQQTHFTVFTRKHDGEIVDDIQ